MTPADSRSRATPRVSVMGRIHAAVRQPGLLIARAALLLIVAWAVFPDWFTSYDPIRTDISATLLPPSGQHWFGTDELGRDVLSRVIHGTGLSLRTTVTAVAIALLVGSCIGLVSGFTGGRTDAILMRAVDVLLAFPLLLLSMAMVTVLGFGATQLSVAVGVALVGSLARVMRAETLKVRKAVYVDAALSIGTRPFTVLIRHVLPNAKGPVLALAVLELGQAVLAIAALSFLGFGAPPPSPEWGALVSAGQRYLGAAWWMSILPGLVIATTVVAVSRVARAIQDREANA
ncbi:ABC transporter permease [Streptomyces umbrinus]|uniref:ABC transporter permease n=1 Tax=Streptomyces umbrinus TaxID=67370 RepID=UPI003C2CB997